MFKRLFSRSRMTRECPVRFYEGLAGQFRRSTHQEKLIAYRGKKFSLEWYFNTQEKSEALEYFTELTHERQKKVVHLFCLLGDMGKIFNRPLSKLKKM